MRIKEIMKEKGITQTELAKILGVNQSTISVAVNGNATIETLRKIAVALGVREYELFDYSPEDVELMHRLGKEQHERNTQDISLICPCCGAQIKLKIAEVINNKG